MVEPRLRSVNIGKPEVLAGKAGLTGIFKRPVVGPVRIGPLGLGGDAVLDRRHHGGPDQAVYIYLQSDYDWWEAELGETLVPGTFGENLTITGVSSDTLSVGDRFTLGEMLLEVTVHREPCLTFARRMGDSGWVRRFFRAGRPGAYARVLHPGPVETGMTVGYRRFGGVPVLVGELMRLVAEREISPDRLRETLAAPVHYKLRADFEARLALAEA